MFKDLDILKPLSIGVAAAISSIALDQIDAVGAALTSIGKILTGLTMIITSFYTLKKIKDNAKQEPRKD